jgi:hypothetical protein
MVILNDGRAHLRGNVVQKKKNERRHHQCNEVILGDGRVYLHGSIAQKRRRDSVRITWLSEAMQERTCVAMWLRKRRMKEDLVSVTRLS